MKSERRAARGIRHALESTENAGHNAALFRGARAGVPAWLHLKLSYR
jgi:hypothetical protein